ncbi:M23 family metallopeptidase [Rhodospirillum centenum]|uniref:M23 peptidase domain protein n=1 Tax=Rhodospirillum centenum (strain ATCC 51521 / SW) TaxID=414684 RepID=B6IUS4_RHOCS|nr:M23 family metallopeptidase [Rhodospirillum centenum]ACJ00006.1 M23 peptidase domain protein [Rhodospirillum centenum SW]
MLSRGAVTVAVAAAIGGLALAATLIPSRTPQTETAVADSAGAGEMALAAKALAKALPVPPDIDAQQGLALAGDAWGDNEAVDDPIERRLISLRPGDTLMQILLRQEVPKEHAHELVSALRSVYNPQRLKSGQEIAFLFDRSEGDGRFVGIEFQPAVERSVSVSFDGVRFQAAEVAKPLQHRLFAVRGTIDSSLAQAASEAGVPIAVQSILINKMFNYDVDWQRDIQPGDRFEVLYELLTTETGEIARVGKVSYAALTLSGKRRELFLFEDADGRPDYFTRKGESVRKALLRTPVDGAKLTSGFGMRMHPLLGYSKMHKGVDFGAPTGTPIYAAGDGVIEEIGAKGAYGNYIRIRHNREIATAYAHLSRFGSGARRGSRVSQGEVIGYVGTTGRSTGPHLHYEVMRGGKQVNPLSVDLPTGRILAGKELKKFLAVAAELERTFTEELQGTEEMKGGVDLLTVSGSSQRPASRGACSKAPGC